MKKTKLIVAGLMFSSMNFCAKAQSFWNDGSGLPTTISTATPGFVGIGTSSSPTDAYLHLYSGVGCHGGGYPEIKINRTYGPPCIGGTWTTPANFFEASGAGLGLIGTPPVLNKIDYNGWMSINPLSTGAPGDAKLHVYGNPYSAPVPEIKIDRTSNLALPVNFLEVWNTTPGTSGVSTLNDVIDYKGQLGILGTPTNPLSVIGDANIDGTAWIGTMNATLSMNSGGTANVGTDLTVNNNAIIGNTISIGNIPDGSSDAYMLTCVGASGIVHKEPMISIPSASLSISGDDLTLHYGAGTSTVTIPSGTSGWVGTATSDLNMTGHDVNSVNTIRCTMINTVGLNATSAVDAANVNTVALRVTGGTTGSATFASDIVVNGITVASDKRFKKNIQHLENTKDKLFQVQPYKYQFNKEMTNDFKFDDNEHFGFIAQEIQSIFPNLTDIVDKNGHLGVKYIEFIPLLLQALKEEDATIQEHETKIANLENRIAELENKKNGPSHTTIIDNVGSSDRSSLSQNIPNPFSKETTIGYHIANMNASASLMISDLNGRQLSKFPIIQTGTGNVVVPVGNMVPGMYLYTLIVDGNPVDTKKMIVNAE